MSDAAAAAAYAEELEELTFNSKPIINSLTMIAEEILPFCPAIVNVVEQKIAAAASDKKLPLLYLLDSICKNVGKDYITRFSQNLPVVVAGAYAVSGPKVRTSIQNLIKTWNGIFPPAVVEQVVAKVGPPGPPGSGVGAPAPSMAGEPQPVRGPPLPPPPIPPQGSVWVGRGGAEGAPPKRQRAERSRNPDAATTGLFSELSIVMQQLREVASGRVTSPQQQAALLSQAAQLCALMGQLPPQSGEMATLHAYERELQQMHQMHQHQVQHQPPPLPQARLGSASHARTRARTRHNTPPPPPPLVTPARHHLLWH